MPALWCAIVAVMAATWPGAPLLASPPIITDSTGTKSTTWQVGGTLGPQVKANGSALEMRNATDTGYAVIRGADPSAAGDVSTKNYVDLRAPSTFSVTAYGAKGDGTTDDTTAIQAAITAAQSAGGGTVVFAVPSPTYKITATLNVTAPHVRLVGMGGVGATDFPQLTQYTYGKPIFLVTADHTTLSHLSGQFGPTTTLSGSTSAGATSITVAAIGTIAVNDWLIFDQYPNLEQAQVASIVGSTITLGSALTYAHANGVWIRDQATVTGPNVYGFPPRDVAGFAAFAFGNDNRIEDCAVQAMVIGVKFRGNPACNTPIGTVGAAGYCDSQTYRNTIDGIRTDFTQYGILFEQQSDFTILHPRYTNATEGQTTAPGHSIYASYLNSLSSAWASGTTYGQYQQVSYSGSQYISISSGNIGHQPDISPTFWTLQTGGALGFQSWSYNAQVFDSFASPGAAFKDWAGWSLKGIVGGYAYGLRFQNAVRAFNLEQVSNFVVDGFSADNFIAPNIADSQAAAVDLLNSSNVIVANGVIHLTDSSGGAINMPAVLSRVDTTAGAVPATSGQHVTFSNIDAYTNYGAAATATFRATGSKYTRFVNCKAVDSGGLNKPAFNFHLDSGDSQYADYGQVVMPTVFGTTSVVSADTGTTGAVFSGDANLLPAGYLVSGPVTRNDAPATIALNPTSTSADVFTVSSPVAAAYKYVNFKNSAGNTEFSIRNSSGIVEALESSTSTPAYLGIGLNSTAGYAANAATFGGISFVDNAGSIGTGAAGVYARSAEAHSVSALGADLILQTVTPGGTSVRQSLRLYGNGDVVLNPTGSALATSATNGFAFIPNMAGWGTGTVTGYTGATGLVFDTTDQRLLANIGSSTFVDTAALTVAGSGPGNGSTFACGSIQRLGSGNSGNSYVLADPTKCKGSIITIKATNNGGFYTYTLTSASGNVEGSASYVFVANNAYASVMFASDGTNWQLLDAYKTNYVDDYPKLHGWAEWNGLPAYMQGTGTATSGSVNVNRLVALNGGTISNIIAHVATAGTALTAATTATISNVTSNAGICRVTATAHGYSTNDVITVAGVVGATQANGAWVITVIDANTFDLVGSSAPSAYTSGGTATRSANVAALYDANGAFLGATVDQASAWTTTGLKTMALAATVNITTGSVYYAVLLYNGSSLAWSSGATQAIANGNLTGANLKWGTNGTAATKLPSSFTPSSNSAGTGGPRSWWVGLNQVAPGPANDVLPLLALGFVPLAIRRKRAANDAREARQAA